MNIKEFIDVYLEETSRIAKTISQEDISKTFELLSQVKKENGRVFFVGIGGGAGTGSHATNDFNKIAKISAISLTDNPSLFTALANDEGWDSAFQRQMEMHEFSEKDCLFVYSVGGGTEQLSKNIVRAVQYAKEKKGIVLGVVGRNTGYTAQHADACIVIPNIEESRVTAHTEDYQLIVDHLLVNLFKTLQKENC
jgi:D-sedoheptulose 7-phosphate isomerase